MAIHIPKYKTTLASSGLLMPELSVLSSEANTDISYDHLRCLVVDDNFLSKPSTQSRQQIWAKLVGRYKFDFDDEIFRLWWQLISETEGYDQAQLAVLRWAQYDLLLRFLWSDIYLPRINMDSYVRSENVMDFISLVEGNSTGKGFFMARSENVRIRIAQHFLLALRECGAAKGKRNKVFVPLPVGEKAACYAGRLAGWELPGSQEILNHWALRWWGGGSAKADEILRRTQMDNNPAG